MNSIVESVPDIQIRIEVVDGQTTVRAMNGEMRLKAALQMGTVITARDTASGQRYRLGLNNEIITATAVCPDEIESKPLCGR